MSIEMEIDDGGEEEAVQQQEFPVGAIKRLQFKNFLTYSYIEFHCGPNLNLVLGSNGSGKSSIVCALALGLGGKPEILMRSPKLSGFVRHGCDRGYVEIELQGERNSCHIIRRLFQADSDRSEWKLDGEKVTQKEVKDLVEKLNIQVDNLCNFLPQERVASFAQMSPKDLLMETMRTIGGNQLLHYYHILCTEGKKEFQYKKQLTQLKSEQEHIQLRNDQMRGQVERYLERLEILDRIELLEKKKPWVEYEQIRKAYIDKKREKKKMEELVKQEEQVESPLLKKIADSSEKINKLNELFWNNEETYKEIIPEIQNQKERINKATEELEELDKSIERNQRQIEKIKKDKRNLSSDYEEKKEKLEEVRAENEEREKQKIKLNDERKVISAQLNDIVNQLREKEYESENLEHELNRKKGTLQTKDRELTGIKNIKFNRIQRLKNQTQGLSRILEAFEKREIPLRAPVFGPIYADLYVKRPEFAHSLENWLSINDNTRFIAQTEDDYEAIMQYAEQNNLNVNVAYFDQPLEKILREQTVSHQELNRLGFDGYLIDFLDAPEPVLAALCLTNNIHRVPVSRGQTEINSEEVQRAGFKIYFTGRKRVKMERSRYGNRELQTSTVEIPEAYFYADFIDKNQVAQLEEEIEELNQQVSQLKYQFAKIKNQIESLNHEKVEVEQRRQKVGLLMQQLKMDHTAQNLESELKLIQDQLESKEIELQRLLAFDPDLKKSELMQKRIFASKKLDAYILDLTDISKNLMEIFTSHHHEKGIREMLEVEHRQKNEALKLAKIELDNAIRVMEEYKAQGEILKKRAMATCTLTAEIQEKFEQLPSTIEEIEELLASEKAKAELNSHTDPAILERYKKREEEIKRLKDMIQEKQAEYDSICQQIEEAKTQFEPQMDSVVQSLHERFSQYFENLGCAGAIRIAKNDDYESWGIDILVKFRDHETLSALNSHRQSGGERSVTIMLFLMSLQSFSLSPFRVVDEINQGMDPRNERLVFKQIVDSVCGSKNQYFLITPKLLPDLPYHEKMKILTVYNGIYVPEPGHWTFTCS